MLKKVFRGEIRAVDEAKGTVIAVVSDASIDRYQEAVSMNAWKKGLAKYKKHPVLLSSHNYNDLTNQIGRALRTYVEGDKLMAEFQYFINEGNEQADWGFKLAQKGMAAFSIGFIPKASERSTSEEREASKKPMARVTYIEAELLEISQVLVPANANALQNGLENESAVIRSICAEIQADTDLYQKEDTLSDSFDDLAALVSRGLDSEEGDESEEGTDEADTDENSEAISGEDDENEEDEASEEEGSDESEEEEAVEEADSDEEDGITEEEETLAERERQDSAAAEELEEDESEEEEEEEEEETDEDEGVDESSEEEDEDEDAGEDSDEEAEEEDEVELHFSEAQQEYIRGVVAEANTDVIKTLIKFVESFQESREKLEEAVERILEAQSANPAEAMVEELLKSHAKEELADKNEEAVEKILRGLDKTNEALSAQSKDNELTDKGDE
ncbi:MAG: hypothetical protein KAR06_11020 [Deltaproteobacteria bacterium]|nr:hypothetical protein [Deltaproteobacteria bacterium]